MSKAYMIEEAQKYYSRLNICPDWADVCVFVWDVFGYVLPETPESEG